MAALEGIDAQILGWTNDGRPIALKNGEAVALTVTVTATPLAGG
jgi:hypothetical protein